MAFANKGLESATCTTQGTLFLSTQLQNILHGKASRQKTHDYVPGGLNVQDEISRSFNILRAAYGTLQRQLEQTDTDDVRKRAASQRFVEDLLFALGYRPVRLHSPVAIPATIDERDGYREFPITFMADGLPVVAISSRYSLDERRPETAENERGTLLKKSAAQLMQILLNADPDYTWGMACNCRTLRFMRTAMTLANQAYIEFNLEEILKGEDYAAFGEMWRLLHYTRAVREDQSDPNTTIWDAWMAEDVENGEPARNRLRENISKAAEILGTGFLQTRGNEALLERIEKGELGSLDYYRQLLRIMYRFIFLFCLEERRLLNTPDAPDDVIARYKKAYSMRRFRNQCIKQRFCNAGFSDAWESVSVVFYCLSRGEPMLALPALGGLFKAEQCPDLQHAKLNNAAFHAAMRLMRWSVTDHVLSVIDYRHMGAEELGSIYESLLEQIPVIDLKAKTFGFNTSLGNERKSTGSYYTPDSLVQSLIKTALNPVIEQKLKENPTSRESALLNMKVIDPACGSGHFLLAAARRLAEELAKARSVDGCVEDRDYRRALHDVIRNCIYGVDINPMAIELARMALWLEGYAEGTPLSFLDHHLRCGNSLLGVFDVNALKLGIAKDAYKATELSDKTVCGRLSRINTPERKTLLKESESHSTGLMLAVSSTNLINGLRIMDLTPSIDVNDEDHRAEIYAKFREELKRSRLKKACDLYIAAYVCVKDEANEHLVPTSGDLGRVLINDEVPEDLEEKIGAAARVCEEQGVFHWKLEFPEVFNDGGFDCVLGNPPWEKPKIEDKAWFEPRLPEIATAKTAAIRKKMIKALSEGAFNVSFNNAQGSAEVSRAEKALYLEYMTALHGSACFNVFNHVSEDDGGRFPLTGVGDVNLYALCAELALNLKSGSGFAGMVLPAGIIGGKSTEAYTRDILKGKISSVYHFENKEGLFKDVHKSYSFVLLTLGASQSAQYVFYATNIKNIEDQRRYVSFTESDLALINPNTQSFVFARSQKDIDLCKKIHGKAHILFNETPAAKNANPWSISNMRMFDMANDSGLFQSWAPDGNLVPLYEGKLFNQFDNRWASFKRDSKKDETYNVTLEEKEDPSFSIFPRHWIDKSHVLKRFEDKQWTRQWMLACRKIARATDERTTIVSVLPVVGVGDNANIIMPDCDDRKAACLLALMNSIVVDFITRIKAPTATLNLFYLKQLPILSPEQLSERDVEYIASRVAMLTRNSDEINAVWLTDYPACTFQKPEERLKIRAELDAYIAHLYGLSREDLRYILDPASVMGDDYPSYTFPVLKNKEIRDFGEYLTQRLVLEAFDAQAALF